VIILEERTVIAKCEESIGNLIRWNRGGYLRRYVADRASIPCFSHGVVDPMKDHVAWV
jgi:hypothetical protein